MSKTPETDANQIFLGINPDEGDYYVPAEFSRKLEQQRDETSHNLASIVAAILKRDGRDVFDMSVIDRLAELHAAERQRNEAVDNYETAVLREHRMQEQRDEALSDLKITQEAWIQAKVERVEALRERDEARETAERYRLEANAIMMQRDELRFN